MKLSLDIENNPAGRPDYTQLPESDGTFVKNFQEHPHGLGDRHKTFNGFY